MNLKTFDAKEAGDRIRAAAEDAKGVVNRALEDCLRDIGIAARALMELPERTPDLLEQSKAVVVSHIEVPDEGTTLAHLGVIIHGRSYGLNGSGASREQPLPKGKYRVIVAFMPLADK